MLTPRRDAICILQRYDAIESFFLNRSDQTCSHSVEDLGPVILLLIGELLHKHGGWLGESTSSVLNSFTLNVLNSQLGRVSDVSVTSRLTSDANNSRVDGSRHAVVIFDVDFRHVEGLLLVGTGFLDILLRRGVHDWFHLESLDGLVFWNTSASLAADDDV